MPKRTNERKSEIRRNVYLDGLLLVEQQRVVLEVRQAVPAQVDQMCGHHFLLRFAGVEPPQAARISRPTTPAPSRALR